MKVYTGFVHVLKALVPKSFFQLPLHVRAARQRVGHMGRLQQALEARDNRLTRHAAQLRVEVSLRWTSDSLADVMHTAAQFAVQTLDGLCYMPVPLDQLKTSIAGWVSQCESLGHGRDSNELSKRRLDLAARALNECGVATDRILRRLDNCRHGHNGEEEVDQEEIARPEEVVHST